MNEKKGAEGSLAGVDMAPIGRSETLGQQVRTQLASAIMAGRFKPGQKLTIRAVAAALDVSLTPAREALYNLAAEGILEMRSNGSVYLPTLTSERIVELTKIRTALEALAAREAALRITDEDIAHISRINDLMVAANERKDYASVMELNWEFHFAIYRASGMSELVRMIEKRWMMNSSYLNVIYPSFGQMDQGINNHHTMVRALHSRDPERLASAVVIDINFAADTLLDMIEAQGTERRQKAQR
ncbi:GntR family transcriptional regulator [Rhizobium sp. CFBP 8762]|uniref:GntR family transcriptional regulator n=1 Tax=Rhizobium sp. CFBP 8762 TaxID=2775279 RepID=UPI00177E53B0|nr:GntR family transcriptional regulator [Rhizobium sp. CFBP 8762]MBD8556149.1 GntR family transcriptional regulator [Rhizobium sp. CFBP 8762]